MRPSVTHATAVIVRALWVRFHVALILFGVVLTGVVANAFLLRLGLRSMPVRYTLDVLGGYAAFFGGIKLWLRYAETALPPRLKHDVVRVEDGQMTPAQVSETNGTKWWEYLDLSIPDLSAADGCLGAVLGAFVGVVLLFVLGVAAYMMAETPALLGEVFVQAALAGALRRGAKRLDDSHWSGAVLRATWLPAAIVLVLAVALGYVVHWHCPSAARLSDALFHCHR